MEYVLYMINCMRMHKLLIMKPKTIMYSGFGCVCGGRKSLPQKNNEFIKLFSLTSEMKRKKNNSSPNVYLHTHKEKGRWVCDVNGKIWPNKVSVCALRMCYATPSFLSCHLQFFNYNVADFGKNSLNFVSIKLCIYTYNIRIA